MHGYMSEFTFAVALLCMFAMTGSSAMPAVSHMRVVVACPHVFLNNLNMNMQYAYDFEYKYQLG